MWNKPLGGSEELQNQESTKFTILAPYGDCSQIVSTPSAASRGAREQQRERTHYIQKAAA